MLKFYKYHGTGNDFILIDDREARFNTKDHDLIHGLCSRRFGIGADGLILLQSSEKYDFHMDYYNSDGRPSSMCGNGGRCIVHFAQQLGIIAKTVLFTAPDGLHSAKIQNELVKLKMGQVSSIKEVAKNEYYIHTGSPHHVKYIATDLDHYDVYTQGKAIRNSERYGNDGSNVNFVKQTNDPHKVHMRTYERGVEDETYSCGTGAVAVALVHAHHIAQSGDACIRLQTKGGELLVESSAEHQDVYLTGPAICVYQGKVNF